MDISVFHYHRAVGFISLLHQHFLVPPAGFSLLIPHRTSGCDPTKTFFFAHLQGFSLTLSPSLWAIAIGFIQSVGGRRLIASQASNTTLTSTLSLSNTSPSMWVSAPYWIRPSLLFFFANLSLLQAMAIFISYLRKHFYWTSYTFFTIMAPTSNNNRRLLTF